MISATRRNQVRCRWIGAALIGMALLMPVVMLVLNGPYADPPIFIGVGLLLLFVGALLIDRADAIKRQLTPTGVCSTCGYDLRGANHAVCPECGNAVTPRTT